MANKVHSKKSLVSNVVAVVQSLELYVAPALELTPDPLQIPVVEIFGSSKIVPLHPALAIELNEAISCPKLKFKALKRAIKK